MNLVTCIHTIFIHIIHRLCDNRGSYLRVSDIIWIRSLSFHHMSLCCWRLFVFFFFCFVCRCAHGKSIGTGSRNIHTHTHGDFYSQPVCESSVFVDFIEAVFLLCSSNLSWWDLNLIKFLQSIWLVIIVVAWHLSTHFTVCSKAPKIHISQAW